MTTAATAALLAVGAVLKLLVVGISYRAALPTPFPDGGFGGSPRRN